MLAARLEGIECRILPFVFEGGDLLSDGNNVYVAANFLARNQPYDVDDRAGLIARIEAKAEVEILLAGKFPVSPVIAQAIKAIPGVLTVTEM